MNRVNYTRCPCDIPDTDEGNMRLYYELELLRSSYESEKLQKQLDRYIQIIDVLGERGLLVCFDTDLEIDKATRKSDWYDLLMKPLPTPNKGESQSDFISRCTSTLSHMGEFSDNKQRVAVCYSQWRKGDK